MNDHLNKKESSKTKVNIGVHAANRDAKIPFPEL